jgi:putative ATP-dependent endonuclease of OLD family
MNITRFTIRNVKSFGEETPIDLHPGLNIFIGPNAGGKSNLLDVLNFFLIQFLLHPWRITEQRTSDGLLISRRAIERSTVFESPSSYLDKHDGKQQDAQEISLKAVIREEDVSNIRTVLEKKDLLTAFEKSSFGTDQLQNNFLPVVAGYDIENIKDKEVEFMVRDNVNALFNPSFSDPNDDKVYGISLRYLNYFEFFSLLIQEYNATAPDENKLPRLYPPLVYFSPYRIPQTQQMITRLAGSDFFSLVATYKKNTSKNISSTFDLANYYFARKLRLLNNNYGLFDKDEEVEFVNKYVGRLGYKRFTLKEVDVLNNTYQALIEKPDGKRFELHKASSGEKEIFNMLLGIFAFNVKNGVVIIDEPDLHLHPLWQNLLLDLFFELTNERKIQFLLVTHSPTFITQNSIKNTLRVYMQNGQSRVVVPPPLDESDKDIFQIVNAFNNAKIFFADKVVLVEGPIDNLIYHSILRRLLAQLDNKAEVIEILDVKGKDNLEKFRKFLDKWQIKSYRIADKGYISEHKDNLFVLTLGNIEDYFPGTGKQHFDIDDALTIAKNIESGAIAIPHELEQIFKNIVSESQILTTPST